MAKRQISVQATEPKPGETALPQAMQSMPEEGMDPMSGMLGTGAEQTPSQPTSQVTRNFIKDPPPDPNAKPMPMMPPEEMVAMFAAKLGDAVQWKKFELQDGTTGVGLFFPDQLWTINAEGRIQRKA